ncbi:hypothetical protein MNJPNG_20445 [Cupriavidus oxalaticus]
MPAMPVFSSGQTGLQAEDTYRAWNPSASIQAPQTSKATPVAYPSQCPAATVFSSSTNSARPAIQ